MLVQAFREYPTPEQFERTFAGESGFPRYTTLVDKVRKHRLHRESEVLHHLRTSHGPELTSALKYCKGSRIITMKKTGSMVKKLLALGGSLAGHPQADQENVPPSC